MIKVTLTLVQNAYNCITTAYFSDLTQGLSRTFLRYTLRCALVYVTKVGIVMFSPIHFFFKQDIQHASPFRSYKNWSHPLLLHDNSVQYFLYLRHCLPQCNLACNTRQLQAGELYNDDEFFPLPVYTTTIPFQDSRKLLVAMLPHSSAYELWTDCCCLLHYPFHEEILIFLILYCILNFIYLPYDYCVFVDLRPCDNF